LGSEDRLGIEEQEEDEKMYWDRNGGDKIRKEENGWVGRRIDREKIRTEEYSI